MVLGLGSFMESYNSNIQIKDGGDLANIFEGVEPCTYEEAIETFFEATAYTEAVSVIITETISLNEAGAIYMNESAVLEGFLSSAIDKIKDGATKVKQFAVAKLKDVANKCNDMYSSNTIIDDLIQKSGAKNIQWPEVKALFDSGFRLPESTKIPNPKYSSDGIVEFLHFAYDVDIRDKTRNSVDADKLIGQALAANYQGNYDYIKRCKEQADNYLDELKNADKEAFGNKDMDSSSTVSDHLKKDPILISHTNGVITEPQWKMIKKFAIDGQKIMNGYRNEIKQEMATSVRNLENLARELTKRAEWTEDSDNKAIITSCVASAVKLGMYKDGSRPLRILDTFVLPKLYQIHRSAIAVFSIIARKAATTKNTTK